VEANSAAHGPDHPTTLDGLNAVARMYLMQGRLDQARELQTSTYRTSLAKHGCDHDCTIISAADLARIARAQGDVQEAARLEEGYAGRYEARFGEDFHSSVLEGLE
jgi:hypothetical protein